MVETETERSGRSIILIPAYRREEKKLGLEGKIAVEWRSGQQVLSDPPNEGYYVEGSIVIGAPMPDKLDLEEAYPACLLVIKSDGATTDAHIEGLPQRGIDDIDFTHYCVGPCRDVSFSPGADKRYNIDIGTISFYTERSK